MTGAPARFEHRHAGHCESGVTSSLLRNAGLDLSEPMALGVASALTFAHFPFVKIGGLPLTSYRMPPGAIFKGVAKALGVKMRKQRFRDPREGRAALDRHLAEGRAVGAQTGVFWLPYFPPQMRFHFNAHNIILFGRDGDEYLVSDPVFENTQRVAAADLDKARFAKGPLAPKGLLYWPESVPADAEIDWAPLLRKAIRRTANRMVRTPVPLVGVPAIRRLAKKVRALESGDPRWARLFIGQVVRMQEEIGTGGGGFRFMYGAFLEEAAERAGNPALRDCAAEVSAAGDRWREFALAGARIVKDKSLRDYGAAAAALERCADAEEAAFRNLLAAA